MNNAYYPVFVYDYNKPESKEEETFRLRYKEFIKQSPPFVTVKEKDCDSVLAMLNDQSIPLEKVAATLKTMAQADEAGMPKPLRRYVHSILLALLIICGASGVAVYYFAVPGES